MKAFPVADRSKGRVCCRSHAGVAGSNPVGGMVVLCDISKDTCQNVRHNEDKETNTDEVQSKREYKKKKIAVGAGFSAPVQTGPGAFTASYTVGTGCLPVGKTAGALTTHPPPSSAEVKEK